MNPSISGKVTDLSVKLGDTVKKGDVLFTLYNPQLDIEVATAQNAYDVAVLSVDQARTSLISAKTSQASTYRSTAGVVTGQQATAAVTSATLAVEAAETAVKAAEITLQDAKDNAAARTVTAGMDGVITTLSLENGDALSGGTRQRFRPRRHHRSQRVPGDGDHRRVRHQRGGRGSEGHSDVRCSHRHHPHR